jgi:hypothetical protein
MSGRTEGGVAFAPALQYGNAGIALFKERMPLVQAVVKIAVTEDIFRLLAHIGKILSLSYSGLQAKEQGADDNGQ